MDYLAVKVNKVFPELEALQAILSMDCPVHRDRGDYQDQKAMMDAMAHLAYLEFLDKKEIVVANVLSVRREQKEKREWQAIPDYRGRKEIAVCQVSLERLATPATTDFLDRLDKLVHQVHPAKTDTPAFLDKKANPLI